MRFKAVIFDLDGTLLDTSADIRAVLNESLKKFGLPSVGADDVIKFIGNGARKLVERAVGDRREMTESVYADYSVNFAECDNAHTRLYPGEAETLSKLKDLKVKLAVLTNKPMRATQRVVEKYLGTYKFDIVIGQTDKYPLKPDPAAALAIIKSLGVGAEDCLFVGDGETDVQTAHAAGIRCLSALWGYRRRETLLSYGATDFAVSFPEILNFI